VGRPSEGLDGGSVAEEVEGGSAGVEAPNVEAVVVAARGQLLLVEGPLEPADFLLVAHHLVHIVVLCADIPHQDVLVARSAGEEVVGVPGNGADSGSVPLAGQDLLVLDAIPQLHLSGVRSNA
jgi:hypothetical protein